MKQIILPYKEYEKELEESRRKGRFSALSDVCNLIQGKLNSSHRDSQDLDCHWKMIEEVICFYHDN